MGWAFKIFDVDNSGSIAVEEIDDSVKVGQKTKSILNIILNFFLFSRPCGKF